MKTGLKKLILQPTAIFNAFFESEKAGGLVLIFCTIASVTLAHTALNSQYAALWATPMFGATAQYWINDGLMAIFFLLIGLEIERELYVGELSQVQNALLPVMAALGGMVVPAGLYALFNLGTETSHGFGIPMATDIAFSLGILSLAGARVPVSLKIFLTALAIIDDLGAILMIAIFYSKGFSVQYFGLAVATFIVLLALKRFQITALWLYLLLGAAMWYFMHHSGVHATIAGVLLAFAIPFQDGGANSPSYRLQHALHKPVAFVIVPLFALANTGIQIPADWLSGLRAPHSFGILAGLLVGKPVGILLFSKLATATGMSKLPSDLNWWHLLGAGMLAGVGFTMSIFITLLAFSQPEIVIDAKIAVFAASVVAGVLGFLVLFRAPRQEA